MELSFIHSPLWLIPGALISALGIYLFYFRSSSFRGTKRWILAGLRFFSLMVILIFLLRPFLLQRENYRVKPRLLWLQDASASMAYHHDSLRLDSSLRALKAQLPSLDERYQQSWFKFAERVSADSNLKAHYTDIYKALNESSERYFGEPLAAMVLISDGIYNKGRNPLQFKTKADSLPIYTLSYGNQQQERDLAITDLRYKSKISQGRILSVEIDLEALNAQGQEFALKLWDANSNVRQMRRFKIDRKDWFESLIFEIPAEERGFKNYRLEIVQEEEDINPGNDIRDIGFLVNNEKYEVLIYAPKANPDVGALRQALSKELNWEIHYQRDRSTLDLSETKVALLFDWDTQLLQNLAVRNIPTLFFADAYAPLSELEMPSPKRGEAEMQFARLNPDFGLFSIAQENRQEADTWPPLEGLYGNVKTPLWAESLFKKRIGELDLDEPLAYTGEFNGRRLALFMGRGLWRWRVYNYKHQGNTEAFDAIFRSWVDYLQSQDREQDLILEFEPEIFAGEPSKVLGKLYNPSGEMVNEEDLTLNLKSETGQSYDYTFSREANFYRLNLDGLEPGFYRYRAEVTLGAELYAEEGRIWIKENNLERQDLQSRRDLLAQLSSSSGGENYELQEWPELLKELQQKEAIGQLAERKNKRELLSNWWLFFVVLTSLGLEWFLRKYWGHY